MDIDFVTATDSSAEDDSSSIENCPVYRKYAHSGRFWDVPLDFELPKQVKLDIGWKLWLGGMPGNRTRVTGAIQWTMCNYDLVSPLVG